MAEVAALCAILTAAAMLLGWILGHLRNWCRTRYVQELVRELGDFEKEENSPRTATEIASRQATVRKISNRLAWRYGGHWFCNPPTLSEEIRSPSVKCTLCSKVVNPEAGTGFCPEPKCWVPKTIYSGCSSGAGS